MRPIAVPCVRSTACDASRTQQIIPIVQVKFLKIKIKKPSALLANIDRNVCVTTRGHWTC